MGAVSFRSLVIGLAALFRRRAETCIFTERPPVLSPPSLGSLCSPTIDD
jgi:hypothetical protein